MFSYLDPPEVLNAAVFVFTAPFQRKRQHMHLLWQDPEGVIDLCW